MTRETTRTRTMQQQPLWATLGLIIVTLVGLIAIVIIRLKTDEVPAGIISITTGTATALAMSSGRRRV